MAFFPAFPSPTFPNISQLDDADPHVAAVWNAIYQELQERTEYLRNMCTHQVSVQFVSTGVTTWNVPAIPNGHTSMHVKVVLAGYCELTVVPPTAATGSKITIEIEYQDNAFSNVNYTKSGTTYVFSRSDFGITFLENVFTIVNVGGPNWGPPTMSSTTPVRLTRQFVQANTTLQLNGLTPAFVWMIGGGGGGAGGGGGKTTLTGSTYYGGSGGGGGGCGQQAVVWLPGDTTQIQFILGAGGTGGPAGAVNTNAGAGATDGGTSSIKLNGSASTFASVAGGKKGFTGASFPDGGGDPFYNLKPFPGAGGDGGLRGASPQNSTDGTGVNAGAGGGPGSNLVSTNTNQGGAGGGGGCGLVPIEFGHDINLTYTRPDGGAGGNAVSVTAGSAGVAPPNFFAGAGGGGGGGGAGGPLGTATAGGAGASGAAGGFWLYCFKGGYS